jgi:phosphoribosylaminoimidazolecarboxamide formyltransferase/IMP cyclohydrolase
MKRALLSVYDKTGLEAFARGLASLDFELVSSGGTSKALEEAGIEHLAVESVTGAPEMMNGRVKTLHPKIHGGILADRSKPSHMGDLEANGITPIDLVVCNLYPFRKEPSIEMIDVGGPTMVRAAAKNFAHVGIVVDPADYGPVLDELRREGALSEETRRRLARAAFAHTAAYDAVITTWFDETDPAGRDPLPATIHLAIEKAQELRYGENPHQRGARYRNTCPSNWWDTAVQDGGKELSYLNLYDTEAAWKLVWDVGSAFGDKPTVAIIKHANPCGLAVADDITAAYKLAHECDPRSAFGGIVASNLPIPKDFAEALAPVFTEVVVAPGYEDGALDVLLAKKNMRVLTAQRPEPEFFDFRQISGGFLVQEPHRFESGRNDWRVVSKVEPTEDQWRDAELAWRVVGHVKSNAIVMAAGGQAVGIGAGQQNRVEAVEIAANKAAGRAKGGALASDAFFPFRDNIDAAAAAGIAVIVSPGGSLRDDEVVAACDEHGIAMIFTGERHFFH